MMTDCSTKFTFIHVPGKTSEFMNNKTAKEYIMKWSMKGHLSIQYYSFNEQFNVYQKQQFAEAFFTDPAVYTTLSKEVTDDGSAWIPVGIPLPRVSVELVACTVTSLEFFDRLFDERAGVTRGTKGDILGCIDNQLHGIAVSDKLRTMLLDEESELKNVYSETERKQLLFRLFRCLCLGGQWCQHEHQLQPYVDMARLLYKNLVRVERVAGTNELVVRSIVLKVTARSEDGSTGLPGAALPPEKGGMGDVEGEVQDLLLLAIDPFTRQLAVFCHRWDGPFVS